MVDPKLITFWHSRKSCLTVHKKLLDVQKVCEKVNSHFTILIQWNSALQPSCYSINHSLPVAPSGTKATNKHPPVITVLSQSLQFSPPCYYSHFILAWKVQSVTFVNVCCPLVTRLMGLQCYVAFCSASKFLLVRSQTSSCHLLYYWVYSNFPCEFVKSYDTKSRYPWV